MELVEYDETYEYNLEYEFNGKAIIGDEKRLKFPLIFVKNGKIELLVEHSIHFTLSKGKNFFGSEKYKNGEITFDGEKYTCENIGQCFSVRRNGNLLYLNDKLFATNLVSLYIFYPKFKSFLGKIEIIDHENREVYFHEISLDYWKRVIEIRPCVPCYASNLTVLTKGVIMRRIDLNEVQISLSENSNTFEFMNEIDRNYNLKFLHNYCSEYKWDDLSDSLENELKEKSFCLFHINLITICLDLSEINDNFNGKIKYKWKTQNVRYSDGLLRFSH